MCRVPATGLSLQKLSLSQLVKNVTAPRTLVNANEIVKRTSDSLSIVNERKHLESG